jgi:cholesterol oxidase
MLTAMAAGVTFNERMGGFLATSDGAPRGRDDYRARYREGKQSGGDCHFEATMLMRDIGAYVRDPQHRAEMSGTFHWDPVGEAPMRDGEFQLFVKNPETRVREMRYRFTFDGPDGEPLTFVGVKWMKPKGRINTWSPSTTLYSRIERADGSVAYGGILKIGLGETLKLFRSVRPVGASDRADGRRAVRAFNSFFAREQLALLREG